MADFEYEPPLEAILRRVVGNERFETARDELIRQKKKECASGSHAWKRVEYDLQGGKWGTDRCTRCGEKRTWHV